MTFTANYGAVREAAKFEKFVDRLIADNIPFGFDIEASYDAPYFIDKGALLQFHPTWFLTGFSFTNSNKWARYVPVAHADGNNVDDVVRTAKALWRLLDTGLGVAHNLSYELKGISRWFRELLWHDAEYGPRVRATMGFFPFLSDSQVEVWLLAKYDPIMVGKDLKSVTKAEFGHEMVHFDDLFRVEGKKTIPKDKRFHLLSSDDPRNVEYACEDALWCLELHLLHIEQVKEEFSLIYRTEMGLIPVLCEMEMGPLDENGVAQGNVYLDWAEIHEKAEEVNAFGDLMNEDILASLSIRLDRTININLGSTKQLIPVLFDPTEGLGLPVKVMTKGGVPSTGDDALKVIAKGDPVIRQILDYRQIRKLYSAYLHKYDVELNYGMNNRCFPNHNAMGALTGRLSVDHVSYQQWPKPYHYELATTGQTFDFGFKGLLLSPDEYRIIGYDFSQVELRILAGMAKETTMLEAFDSGQDIHKATASRMLKIPLDQVTKKDRAKGKTFNFGIVYGIGPEAIAEDLSSPEAPVTADDAKKLLQQYFDAFPKLKGWIDQKVAEGSESGYVHTLFGRKFTVWEYRSTNNYIRSKGDRMCVNAPVQGSAADYMKIGMVRVAKAIKDAGMQDKIRLIMTIHDALEFYVHESVTTQQVIDLVQPAISFPISGLPEIRADWHEGRTWGSVVEIKQDANKQITHYELEDVEQEFATFQDAEAYMAEGPAQFIEVVPAAVSDEPVWAHSPDYVQRAIVTMTSMPTEDQYVSFVEFLGRNPGDGSVILGTPEGDISWPTRHTLTLEQQTEISMILGGASLRMVAESADTSSVLAGMAL